jgi:hypothetical protein
MLAMYIVDGIALAVVAVALTRTVIRRRRHPDWTDNDADAKPNVAGNIIGNVGGTGMNH